MIAKRSRVSRPAVVRGASLFVLAVMLLPLGILARVPIANAQAGEQIAVLVHGWQGGELDITKYRCSNGIQGPYTSDPPQFGALAQTLLDRGYTLYYARWTTSAFQTITAEAAARCLATQIGQVKNLDADNKVTLVAHSMGGLVSRAYIESTGYNGDVEQLVTFGTPHVGVNLGVVIKILAGLDPQTKQGLELYCAVSPGTCQLSSDQMLLYNLIHQPSGTIPYDFVGANGAPPLWPLVLTEGANDGIVGLRSGIGHDNVSNEPIVLGSGIGRWQTGDVHFVGFESLFSDLGYPNKLAYFDSPTSVACLEQFLQASGSGPCAPFADQSAVPSRHMPDQQYTPTIAGSLANGESRTYQLRLDGSAAYTMLSWTHGNIDLTLTAPDGTVITPANAKQQLRGGGYAQAAGSEWFPTALYVMQQPQVGEWQATLTASDVVSDTDFVLFGAMVSPFRLSVDQPSSVAQGQTFNLAARIHNAGTAVSGAAVDATLISASGTLVVPMLETEPGVYTAAIAAPLAAGRYQLSIQADGPAALPFSRQIDRLLTVRPDDVQRSGTATLQAEDSNSNGRIDRLNLRVPILNKRAAQYVAQATLRAANGAEVARVRAPYTWDAGAHTIDLAFDGTSISNGGLDGPYSVDLVVVAAGSAQLMLDEQSLIQTAAYGYNQFEVRKRMFVPLARRR